MEKYEIERLRSINIEEVAERLGLEVKRHKCLCCFHNERNPSMVFNLRKNTYCCYSCGAHGDVIDLVMQVLNKGFKEACEWLGSPLLLPQRGRDLNPGREDKSSPLWGDKRGAFSPSRYSQYFEHPWLSPEACHFLFDERKLNPRVVRWCRLNSYRDKQGIHWLQIPYYDIEGKLVCIQSRNLSPPKQGGPRFRFPSGESCHLYGQQIIPKLRPDTPIWIAEGPSDTWALLSSSRAAVGIPSATLLKPNDLLPLAGRECHIYPDKDAAGESLYQKLLSAANSIGFCLIRHELPEGCKDYSDFFMRQKQSPHLSSPKGGGMTIRSQG